jgi:hypothetical protein
VITLTKSKPIAKQKKEKVGDSLFISRLWQLKQKKENFITKEVCDKIETNLKEEKKTVNIESEAECVKNEDKFVISTTTVEGRKFSTKLSISTDVVQSILERN